jgi:hypothetical protein
MIAQDANPKPTDRDVATSSQGFTGRSWCRIRLQYRNPAEEKGVSHDRRRRYDKAKRRKIVGTYFADFSRRNQQEEDL